MGTITAMYSGVAGLSVHGKALSSVADNIANVSTHGYKASRANFGDVMVKSLTVGGTVVQSVGSGSRVLQVQNLLTQGSFESTDIPTDLAISGRGFFQVTHPDTDSLFYTRAGQFQLDKEGYLVNPTGHRLRGLNVDENGNLQQIVADLRILLNQANAIPTNNVDLSINLDAEDDDTHHPSERAVPSQEDTFNYLNTMRVYDSLGIGHDLSLFYQRLDRGQYAGPTPSGSVNVWKVSVFEGEDGSFNSNNVDGINTFYLHFNSDGELVGSSTGQPAYGDQYTFKATVAGPSGQVSNRIGEQLTFTPSNGAGVPDPAGTQSFVSHATLTPQALAAGESLTIQIGTDTYTVSGAMTAAQVSNNLVSQINAANLSYFAVPNNGDDSITIYNKTGASSPASVAITADTGTTKATLAMNTLAQVQSAINDGKPAVGVFYPTGTGPWQLTIDGTVFNGASAAALAAAINADANYDAYEENGTVVVNRAAVGAAGNVVFSVTGGTGFISGTNLLGGQDGDTEGAGHNVVASGTTQLTIARTDGSTLGSNAVINLPLDNTLGGGMGLDFSESNHDVFAADAEIPTSSESDGEHTITFNWLNAYGSTEPQEIEFDYTPSATSFSTFSAGSSETFYLFQDGAPRGTLNSLDIGRDGIISGKFSNGTLRILGGVILADFAAPDFLRRDGENLWRESVSSGEAVVNQPGQGGLGSVESGSLEQSNVDLADQFVKMIQYQRAFQANSKTISTTDQMLADLINLKR